MTAPVSFSNNALKVLQERYLRRDESGRLVEAPLDMLRRVARAVAAPARQFAEDAEFWEARFLARLERLEFLPNSPTLMNAGLPRGQLAACFVLPIDDDLESIFSALSRTARIHQTGGGTGFSFSALRPKDDRVRTTGGLTSGPLSFMELFDLTTAVIRQGGRRRGANMGVLRVDHPDIEEFIEAKKTPGNLENFNLSVGITEEFLSAYDSRNPFHLRNPRTGRRVRAVDPVGLFDAIAQAAWSAGEPGLLFLDQINRNNPTPALGQIAATNPCGEQPLLPHESCTLASINLAAFARDNGVNWDELGEVIQDVTVFLDNVIEANSYPYPEIEAATRRTRKIGLGVMGWAELLARVGVPYDSEEALALGAKIAGFVTSEARKASMLLGERRGSFPAFHDSVWPERGCSALRNATVTCMAPTGSISMIAGTSSGIEPYFALATKHRVLDGQTLIEINPLLVQMLRAAGKVEESALRAVRLQGTVRGVDDIPEDLRRRFPTALEIDPSFHLRMQAAFQAHTDAGVSKTVNLPARASVDDILQVFLLARQLRLKGITVYRYGSRPDQTLSLIHEQERADCRECAV